MLKDLKDEMEDLYQMSREDARELVRGKNVVAFDEVAGISFTDKDGVQINGSVRFSGLGSSSGAKECLRVALDAGARRILIPSSSVGDFQTVPGELLSKFQNSFYADPIDAVFKSMGVE